MISSVLRAVARGVKARTARSDLMLVAAGMTFYAVVGLVPLLAVGLRVAAAFTSPADVEATGRAVAAFVPGPLGVDRAVTGLAAAAATVSWWAVLAAVLPVSLYAEGMVRCLERFSQAPERRSRTLRGRLLTAPLLGVAGLAVVLGVTGLRPLLQDPFGTGTPARLLGIFVAFCILWAGATAVLCLVFRLFASTPLRPWPLLIGAAAAGSWLAGQTLGYVLTLRLVTGFARAYGDFAPAGVVAALAFLLYLNHVVVLLGYALALTLHEEPVRIGRSATTTVPPAGEARGTVDGAGGRISLSTDRP